MNTCEKLADAIPSGRRLGNARENKRDRTTPTELRSPESFRVTSDGIRQSCSRTD